METYLLVLISVALCLQPSRGLRVGRGIADITGQVSEGKLYGYASPEQDARGLHMRQYSRAFAFEQDGNFAVFVVAEITMISQAIHTEVMELLAVEFGDIYTRKNIMLTPTHSHAAPGGYHTYVLYGFPSGGFEMMTFRAAVDGIVKSIRAAHEDLQDGQLRMSAGDLTVTSVNRSPYSYDQNPKSERSKYNFNVDVDMTVVKMLDNQGEPIGMISLFPVHTTSMKNDNHLVSSDNKGYAAQMMERALNNGKFPLKGSCGVIAAFAQTAEGDVSPNTNHAKCEEDDSPCDAIKSTCPADKSDPNLCTGRGPSAAKKENEDEFRDTEVIGSSQYIHAMHLGVTEVGQRVGSDVDFRFKWVNMSEITVTVDGQNMSLCRPALGYSFGAGATDGPGVAPFTQGMLKSNIIYDRLVGKLFPGSKTKEMVRCHKPKPVLLPTANMLTPYPYWHPEIVPVQIMRVGKILFLGIPAEVTTMAGRRLQKAAKKIFSSAGIDVKPFVMSMANSYSSYVVTPEEYQVQRYEAASTIYGPYTLNGYIEVIESLATSMIEDSSVESGTPPPDLRYPDEARGLTRKDRLPEGTQYGQVVSDVQETYAPGETASVTFLAGNPRNNLMTDRSYLEVQKYDDRLEDWVILFEDAHWETKFHWVSDCHGKKEEGSCEDGQSSQAVIEWVISKHQPLGSYRIVHKGHAKYPDGVIAPYAGISGTFTVAPKPPPEMTYYKKPGKQRSRPKSQQQKAQDITDFFAQLADTKMNLPAYRL